MSRQVPSAHPTIEPLVGTGGIEQRASFDRIRYANCWEDADILCEALQPRQGMSMLSIASAGDNALALLAEGAAVVAADLSPAQLACLELRCAAFRELEYPKLLAFLGVEAAEDRQSTYLRIAPQLSQSARDFWNAHADLIASGVIHGGKFESFFRLFRRRIIPLVHRPAMIEQLFQPRDDAGRRTFYDQQWDNWRWRLLFKTFFSRTVMGKLGRDPEFFRYVEGSVADRILQRAREGVIRIPAEANPYLEYILTGRFERALPRYLRPEYFEPIRAGLQRLSYFRGPIEQVDSAYPGRRFDGFNLSDIFEYVDQAATTRIYSKLLKLAAPGARFAYWNTLAPRRLPESLHDRARPLERLSRELFQRDKAFFYCSFYVDEAFNPS